MNMLKTDNQQIIFSGFVDPGLGSHQTVNQKKITLPKLNFLQPLRQWLDSIEIENQKFARFVAKVIPSQCPFERDVVLLGRKIAHIPPMCKLNPLYDELVSLRFRALCYLVDQCGEDIQSYC